MQLIHIETTVQQPIQQCFACYTQPQHIVQWNQASPDWHCPKAENDLRVGGSFCYVMAARDGSFQFDFAGRWTLVQPSTQLAYVIDDGRSATITFQEIEGGATHIAIAFEPESTNTLQQQQQGWQAILDSFKAHCEQQG